LGLEKQQQKNPDKAGLDPSAVFERIIPQPHSMGGFN
jgi:hypothetical protein